MWRIFRTSNNLFRQTTTTSSRETSSSSSSSCTWKNGGATVAVAASLLSCQDDIEQQPLLHADDIYQSNQKSSNENSYGRDRRRRCHDGPRDGDKNGDTNEDTNDGMGLINFDRQLSENTTDHNRRCSNSNYSNRTKTTHRNGVMNLLWNSSRGQHVQCEEEPPTTAAAAAAAAARAADPSIKRTPHREKSATRARLQTTSGNNEDGIRFRRRRMTLISSAGGEHNNMIYTQDGSHDSSEKDKDNDNDNHEEDGPSNHDNVMYSTEFDEWENSTEDGAATATINHATSTSTERPSPPPFSPNRVASFSYHGLEPHLVLPPFIEDENEDENENSQRDDGPSSTDIEGDSHPPPSSLFLNLFGSSASVAPDTTTAVATTTAASHSNSDSIGREQRMVKALRHKINQDRGHVIHPYGMHDRTALFAVYDGHGTKGDLLAEYTMHALSAKLQVHPAYLSTSTSTSTSTNTNTNTAKKETTTGGISTALRDTIREIDEEIKHETHLQSRMSGSTACVAVLRGRTLCVANVGDSRAVLAQRRDGADGAEVTTDGHRMRALDLSMDQNANDPKERERIVGLGGYITTPEDKTLSPRVWLDQRCTLVGLAMSRSIGDHALESVGVIAEPVIVEHDLKRGDQFLILASDGVWEFISSEEAVHIVDRCFNDGLGADEACKELVRVATQQWEEKEGDYRDDITVIVVCLDDIWDAAATAGAGARK